MTTLRHTVFSQDPAALGQQLGENAQDTNAALDARLVGRMLRVDEYLATGATTTRIQLPVGASRLLSAVLLVRVAPTRDPGADLTVSGRLNFTSPSADTVNVYEPAGLTANTLYDLTFLVLEGGV